MEKKKKKQATSTATTPSQVQKKDRTNYATQRVPSIRYFSDHRKRFGAPAYDQKENMIMHKAVKRFASAKRKSGDIPWKWAQFYEKTQFPTIRLWYAHDDVDTTSGNAVLDVMPINLGEFLNFADFTGAFDEFRPIGGEMEYHSVSDSNTPTGATAARYLGTGVVVIDYGDGNALTTFDNGISFDTREFFNLFHSPTKAKNEPVRLPVWLEPLPDQEWLSVTTGSATNFAWMKFYVEANHVIPTANEVGFVTGWMDFQWRQASGA